MLSSELQEQFVRRLPPSFRRLLLHWDTSRIDEMQETLAERVDREVAQTEAGHVTINEVRAGWGRDPLPWGDDPPPGYGRLPEDDGDDTAGPPYPGSTPRTK